MPACLQGVDWEAIKNDRLNNGLSYEALSAKYGVKPATIAQHAKRHAWSPIAKIVQLQTHKAARQAVTNHMREASALVKPQLEAAMRQWVDRATQTAQQIVEQVSENLRATRDPEDLVKLANALDRADGVGRRAYRMDAPETAGAGRPLVSMHFGEGSLSIVLGGAHAPMDSGPVIDVDSPDNSGLETT